MADDAMPVPAQVNIAFNCIGVLLPGQIKGRHGVFRRPSRGAAMGDNFNGIILFQVSRVNMIWQKELFVGWAGR